MRTLFVLPALLASIASLCMLASSSVVRAEPPAAPTTMPTARAVMDHYITATGGAKAYESIKARRTEATLSMKENGVNGTIITMIKPGRAIVRTTLEGLGVIQQGMIDGRIWECSDLSGGRLITGPEAEIMTRAMTLDDEIRLDQFTSAEVVGIEEVDGVRAHRMDLVSKAGQKESRYFDVASGLLVRVSAEAELQVGKLLVTSQLSQYADFAPLKIATMSRQNFQGQTIEMTTTKVEFNTEMPDDEFAPPAEVQALIDAAAPAK